jgi:hypothetical protein
MQPQVLQEKSKRGRAFSNDSNFIATSKPGAIGSIQGDDDQEVKMMIDEEEDEDDDDSSVLNECLHSDLW